MDFSRRLKWNQKRKRNKAFCNRIAKREPQRRLNKKIKTAGVLLKAPLPFALEISVDHLWKFPFNFLYWLALIPTLALKICEKYERLENPQASAIPSMLILPSESILFAFEILVSVT